MLPNISRSKGNQAITFGQLNIMTEIFFFKINPENEIDRLVPDVSLFFRRGKSKWSPA